jgi:hypothetical protein
VVLALPIVLIPVKLKISVPLVVVTPEEIAADERLEAQCALIDFLPQIAEQNYAWRIHGCSRRVRTTESYAGNAYLRLRLPFELHDGKRRGHIAFGKKQTAHD